MRNVIAKALTIAGSDSGGCAGIQADLKTFAALGVHGMSALTAITAQNTCGVWAIQNVSARVIRAQVDAVLSDIGAGAVKSGMIPGPSAIRAIARCLRRFRVRNYVLDPVMVATTGARLMSAGAEATLCRELMPLALITTPNRHEAESLARRPVRNRNQMRDAARAIHDLGPRYVLIKGGHFSGDAADLLFDGRDFQVFSSPRIRTRNLHGAGCTLAAAITAHLALGCEPLESIEKAKRYVAQAVKHSFVVGQGPGPLGHFFGFWR